MLSWWAEHAWLPEGIAARVLFEGDTTFTAVRPDTDPPPDAVRLPGLTLPGLADAHSHAFHRALRGRTQTGGGTFWTWREQMYTVATRLDPDSYFTLARAVYAEMALAGITCVGEFHYLHHGPGGVRYGDPNAMGAALVAAAADAGIRITLLDTCYLTGGIGTPLAGPLLRFGDGSADAWAARVSDIAAAPHLRVGAALHSVRAVPRDQIEPVVAWAADREAPLHAHLSEQPAENDACLAAYGATPARVLTDAGALGPRTSLVHATHLTDEDVALLKGSYCCFCPTTERDLADGIGPSTALRAAGATLTLGSDSHAVIDLFEEARAVELHERLRTGQRGHWPASSLLAAATSAGHDSLGWPGGGRLAVGAPADLVTIATDSPRTAGFTPSTAAETAVFAAGAADVRNVVVGGRTVVADGVHRHFDVGRALAAAIEALP